MGSDKQLISPVDRDDSVAFKVSINQQAGLLSKSSKVFRGYSSEPWRAPREALPVLPGLKDLDAHVLNPLCLLNFQ